MSNPTGIWHSVHQFQALLLLIITGAYIPKNVVDFLIGLKFSLFSFSFLNLHQIVPFKYLLNWFYFDQSNAELTLLQVKSESSFYNNFGVLFVILVLIVVHATMKLWQYNWSRTSWCKNLSKKSKFSKFNFTVEKILLSFHFSIYIRILLEWSQFLLITSFSEIKVLNVDSVTRVVSLLIAFSIKAFCLLFLVLTFYFWWQFDNSKISYAQFYFRELAAGLKTTKVARGYTAILLSRRISIVTLLIFLRYSSIINS